MGFFNRSSSNQTTQELADEVTGGVARTVTLTKDATGAPATNADVVEARGGVDMVKKFNKAGISLSKRGLDGIRAEAVLLLDHSLSMVGNYENGTVQKLVERALGFALQIDGDGNIPVIRFDSDTHSAVNVNLGNYANISQSSLYQRSRMGSTDLTRALGEVFKMAKKTDAPLFVIIITDGVPDSTTTASEMVRKLAAYPVFLKFLAIPDRGYFPGKAYLESLDDMTGRVIDNADSKFIEDPAGMADLAFADAMTDEMDTWIAAAQSAGILR